MTVSSPSQAPLGLNRSGSTAGYLLRSPAAWTFGLLWLSAVLYLLVTGHTGLAARGAVTLAVFLLLGALTVRLTAGGPPPPSEPEDGRSQRRLYLQLALLLLVILFTMASGMAFHGNLPGWLGWLPLSTGLPIWENPFQYFVLPGAGLLILGARPRELGLGPGRRTWAAIALWCALPGAAIVYFLVSGAVTPALLGRRLVSNFFHNGFFEEFLFRGALETRLVQLLRRTDWAVVLSALAFGVWHLGLNTAATGGYITGIAASIAAHAPGGLGFSILFQRTRNLLAPSVLHVLINSVG